MADQEPRATAAPVPLEELGEAPPDVASFGRWLVQERELRGLDRDQVGRLTKLGPGIVVALESGELARMPPRAYLLGYLRAWATAVGLDPDDVVLRWQEVEGAGGEPAPEPAPRARTGRRLDLRLLVAALLAAAALALVVFASTRRPQPLKLDPSRTPAARGSYYQPEAAPHEAR
ncbi:MAG TPA: helix-turn-helix transcriptional regulator [Anaeromyxobacteraceae bacterium]|jgi:cytoskeletal protein RodZ|nr:helix-turn-helix transcriptional regulator [Anaeromyxobacteraceae bacterium]